LCTNAKIWGILFAYFPPEVLVVMNCAVNVKQLWSMDASIILNALKRVFVTSDSDQGEKTGNPYVLLFP
jgi:hypothetical protein